MNNVHAIRPFITAKRYGPNVYRAVRDAILAEQRAGHSGNEPLKPYAEQARRARMTPPEGAA